MKRCLEGRFLLRPRHHGWLPRNHHYGISDKSVSSSSIVVKLEAPRRTLSAFSRSKKSVQSFVCAMGVSFSSRTDAEEEGNKKSPPRTESLCHTPLPQWGRVVSSGHLQRGRLPDRVTGLRASPTARYAIQLLPTPAPPRAEPLMLRKKQVNGSNPFGGSRVLSLHTIPALRRCAA
jgi:hypothetical protein